MLTMLFLIHTKLLKKKAICLLGCYRLAERAAHVTNGPKDAHLVERIL